MRDAATPKYVIVPENPPYFTSSHLFKIPKIHSKSINMFQRQVLSGSQNSASRLEIEFVKKVKFQKHKIFYFELNRRIDNFLQNTERNKRDCLEMYSKTGILLFSFAALYALLVFCTKTWWQALPLSVLLGFVAAGIGFNIQHDGGHRAYSNLPWVNKLMAMTIALIGGSAYNWYWQHAVFHHNYVNIAEHDNDLDIGIFGRLTPYQPWKPWYQWQHYYLWLLYGLMGIKWQLYDDFHNLLTGKMEKHRYPRPKRWDLINFIVGKIIFLSLVFGTPLLIHPAWVVLTFYGVGVFVFSIVLSVVFQLAHAVEEAEFPLPKQQTGQMDNDWAIHQIETTVNFSRNNAVLTWFLGGLNFQIEHHLFPHICHVNYPSMSKIVEETCQEFGINYRRHKTFMKGLISHFRWLQRMGAKNFNQI